jgi:methylated-DNA-[protein]-cysteine S-methyltransferase
MQGIAYYSSPVGELVIESDENKIVGTNFLKDSKKEEMHTPVILQCIDELNEYFFAGRKFFSVEFELRGTDFQKKVWNALLTIPFGKTLSYADLAVMVGDIKSVRAVGMANGQNSLPVIVPCHRVIGKDGNLMGYGGGLDKKQWLLRHEGVLSRQTELFSTQAF